MSNEGYVDCWCAGRRGEGRRGSTRKMKLRRAWVSGEFWGLATPSSGFFPLFLLLLPSHSINSFSCLLRPSPTRAQRTSKASGLSDPLPASASTPSSLAALHFFLFPPTTEPSTEATFPPPASRLPPPACDLVTHPSSASPQTSLVRAAYVPRCFCSPGACGGGWAGRRG